MRRIRSFPATEPRSPICVSPYSRDRGTQATGGFARAGEISRLTHLRTRADREGVGTSGGGVRVDPHRPRARNREHLAPHVPTRVGKVLADTVRAIELPVQQRDAGALGLEVDDLTCACGEGVIVP